MSLKNQTLLINTDLLLNAQSMGYKKHKSHAKAQRLRCQVMPMLLYFYRKANLR